MIARLRELLNYHRWHRRRWYPTCHRTNAAILRAIGLCPGSIPVWSHAWDARGWCWVCRSWRWGARVRRWLGWGTP